MCTGLKVHHWQLSHLTGPQVWVYYRCLVYSSGEFGAGGDSQGAGVVQCNGVRQHSKAHIRWSVRSILRSLPPLPDSRWPPALAQQPPNTWNMNFKASYQNQHCQQNSNLKVGCQPVQECQLKGQTSNSFAKCLTLIRNKICTHFTIINICVHAWWCTLAWRGLFHLMWIALQLNSSNWGPHFTPRE